MRRQLFNRVIVLAAVLIPLVALQLPAFKDGMAAFGTRWQDSTTSDGGFKEAIVNRMIDSLFGSFQDVGYSGFGTGYSTNVGQMLLTSQVGFGAAEAEWGRLLFDNGFVLGGLMVAYRVALAGAMVLASARAWRRGSAQSLVFASACFFGVLEGQWGQTTTLGAAVIGAGLALAAADEENTN